MCKILCVFFWRLTILPFATFNQDSASARKSKACMSSAWCEAKSATYVREGEHGEYGVEDRLWQVELRLGLLVVLHRDKGLPMRRLASAGGDSSAEAHKLRTVGRSTGEEAQMSNIQSNDIIARWYSTSYSSNDISHRRGNASSSSNVIIRKVCDAIFIHRTTSPADVTRQVMHRMPFMERPQSQTLQCKILIKRFTRRRYNVIEIIFIERHRNGSLSVTPVALRLVESSTELIRMQLCYNADVMIDIIHRNG